MEVTHTKFFVANGIPILSLMEHTGNIQQERFRRNERRGRAQGLC